MLRGTCVLWNTANGDIKKTQNLLSSASPVMNGNTLTPESPADAAKELQVMRETNNELIRANRNLRRRIADLEKVSKNHMLLKSNLTQAELDCQSAKAQVQSLQRKLNSLEAELEFVKKRSSAENQRHETKNGEQALSPNDERTMLNSRVTGEQEVARVTELQVKLSELERKYDMQVARHEQLTREMTQLRQLGPGTSPSQQQQQQQQQLMPVSRSSENSGSASSRTVARTTGDRGRHYDVYVAKYSYDPFQFSPNDNPEAELKLNAGDYIFIYGQVDEDGFYDGELMDGRKGLVPSNFIQKVSDEELADFHMQSASRTTELTSVDQQTISEQSQAVPTTAGTRVTPSVNSRIKCIGHGLSRRHVNTAHSNAPEDVIDAVDDVTTMSSASDRLPGICVSELVPEPSAALCELGFPRDLRLERQLVSSVLMAWSPPDQVPQAQIQSYQVSVDGQLRATIRGNDRTKALLEKVDIAKVHRVSVRAVTNRGQSKDQQCTILIGKEVSMAPTEVQLLSVASTSAVIGWTPGSSALEHIVTVNSVVRTTIRPGGYRCTITGLKPVTSYTVSVQPRFGNALQQAALTVVLNFQTLRPELPDAPAEVQVEPGPQHGTLLVMWLPVRITDRSCSSSITGYSVYIDGRRVKEMTSPTGDHILLESQDFASVFNPRQITIRTRTTDKESNDSAPVNLTPEMLSEVNLTPEMLSEIQHQGCRADPSRSSSTALTQADSRLQALGPIGGPANSESGFSASQLSPMELHYGPIEVSTTSSALPGGSTATAGLSGINASSNIINGYGTTCAIDTRSSVNSSQPLQQQPQQQQQQQLVGPTSGRHSMMSAAMDVNRSGIGSYHHNAMSYGKQLPQIEITRDNNGSLSDSSFDVESEENFDRRRAGGGSNSLPGVGATPSRLVNHHYSSRTSGGRQHSGRHGSGDAGVSQQTSGGGRRAGSQGGEVGHRSARSSHLADGGTGRTFVALFDYDPVTMSPNPNGVHDELPFREGQIIKILRGRDPDGFYLGEVAGRRGLVPSNMVSEVDDTSAATGSRTMSNHVGGSRVPDGNAEPIGTSSSGRRKDATPPSPRRHHKNPNNKSAGQHEEIADVNSSRRSTRRHLIAAYNYDATAQSDLSFKSGDHVTVFGDPDEDGFFYAEIDGRRGLVPADYLRENIGSQSSGAAAANTHSAPPPYPAGAGPVTAPGPTGSNRSASSVTVTSDRRSRSTGSQYATSMQQQSANKPVERGQSDGGSQPQTTGSSRYHQEPDSSGGGRSRRHRSTEDDGHAVSGRVGSSVTSGATDRSRSASGANSGSAAAMSAAAGPRATGVDRGTRSYGGGNGISDGPVGNRHAQQR